MVKTLSRIVGLVLGDKDRSSDGIMLTDGKIESTLGTFDENSDEMVLADDN